MGVEFACECGKTLSVPDDRAGRKVRCPGCGKIVAVPAPPPSRSAALTVMEWASRTQGISGPIALGSVDLVGGAATELVGSGPVAAGMAHPALASLGRYPVAGFLGRGGMGEILLVRDVDLGRELAAKVILQSEPERVVVEKFLLEAQVTGQLEHPNIVPVHELGLDAGGRLYLTMKRVRGKDLKRILDEERRAAGRASSSTSGRRRAMKRGTGSAERGTEKDRGLERECATPDKDGAYSLVRLLDIFLKVCDAVAFAHSKGVIHRDLKPANVMAGEFGEVLVMDWGLAKVRRAGESGTGTGTGTGTAEQTQAGAVMGTPAYMPPEQARGEIERIDERCDIYSLGGILYEILTLAPPFTGKTPLAVLEKVKEGKLVPPSRRAPGRTIPRELEAAVLRAMAKDPDKRYSSVAELKKDIEAYQTGGTLAAARYSPWQLLAKWARRNKALVLGTAAAALALAGGLVT
ncbi:MAG: serine/threonine protein kinase, partial [Planctomycetes bacterium]|nr:serine/threonine protein kinase [Planctomycetota bacterium]